MRLRFLAVILIFVLGFLVRLYRFDSPVADWHSFRQSDTNAVSVIYARDGINLLYPRYFDISNIQSGIDNPKGYRFVEFPVYNAVQAGLFRLFGVLSIEQWGRVVSIIATLAGAYFTYQLMRKYANEISAFFAAFFYLFLPFSVFYGRSILPDPSMTASIMGGIYFFDKYVEKLNLKYLAVSAFFTALAFLLKPYALFFTLPMVYLAFQKFKFKIFTQWQLWLFAAAALIPFVLWRKWIGNYPEGIPVSNWLFNGNGIRFRPAFFRWIFYERVTRLILGYAGIAFLAAGTANLIKNKKRGIFLSFAVSSLLYLFIIATGNVQHDYYQILLIPTISMFAGLGINELFSRLLRLSNETVAATICAILIVVSLFFGWESVKDYFNINDRGMVAAAQKANEVLPASATVIAPYDGSTTFLNLIKRRGWPTFQVGIEELTGRGAEYLIIANPTKNDFEGFGKMYKSVASGKEYLILKLN